MFFHSHNIPETEEIENRLVVPGTKVEVGMGGRCGYNRKDAWGSDGNVLYLDCISVNIPL